MTEDSGRAAWLRQARAYLRDADPVLARLIDERPDFDPQAWMTQLPAMDLYGSLLFQVAGQQLSVAATRTILGRIEAMFGGRLPAPAELLALDPARAGRLGGAVRPDRGHRAVLARAASGQQQRLAAGHRSLPAVPAERTRSQAHGGRGLRL